LSDIENSTILAKETSVQDVKTKVDGIDTNLEVINRNVQDASLLIPASEELT
jgi:hypothetical protein